MQMFILKSNLLVLLFQILIKKLNIWNFKAKQLESQERPHTATNAAPAACGQHFKRRVSGRPPSAKGWPVDPQVLARRAEIKFSWLTPHAADPTGKIGRKIQKIRPEIRQNQIFDNFGPFWPVFGVPEVRDPFKKLPGGDTLRFHRI